MLQISSLTEENNQVNEIFQSTKIELQSVIAKLEEQVTLERSKADTLVSEIEKLRAVAAEKSVLEAHVEELEKTLKKFESQLKEEVMHSSQREGYTTVMIGSKYNNTGLMFLQVENATAASVKVSELTSKLQEGEHVASDRDVLNEQVLQLQKELQAAQSSIAEQVSDLFFCLTSTYLRYALGFVRTLESD